MSAPAFTTAERIFLQRMLPHWMGGKSIKESAAAVLADDERLFTALHDRREVGDAIRRELATTVYRSIHQRESPAA